MNIDIIKNETLEYIENRLKIDISNFVNRCYNEDSKYCSVPIYYFFDHCINENIGTIPNVMTNIQFAFNLNDLFSLLKDDIHSVGVSGHATIFYYFDHDSHHYIYYSNSGLGIENQMCDTTNTSCKLIHMLTQMESNLLILFITELINKFITTELSILMSSYDSEYYTYLYISEDDYKLLCGFQKNQSHIDMKYKEQLLCYILINHYIAQSKNIDIYECTFNRLINGKDSDFYKENIKKIIQKPTGELYTINELIKNCSDFNKEKYSNIVKDNIHGINSDFKEIIDKFNIKIENIDIPSFIKYLI